VGALGGAGARAAGLAGAGGGGFAAAADEDRAVERLPPDDFAVCPELALLLLVSPELVCRLAFDGFSDCGFAANCGWPGCVREVDCSVASWFCTAPALPVGG